MVRGTETAMAAVADAVVASFVCGTTGGGGGELRVLLDPQTQKGLANGENPEAARKHSDQDVLNQSSLSKKN